jgi:3-oxoacyl-[acyl-carrier protein] reductase
LFDLTGRFALVTGASGGLGGAIARALHSQGASVGLSGTRRQALEALAGELGARAFVLPCDLSDAPSVEALVPAAEAAMGGLDILVNNAGVTRDNLFMRMKDEEWEQVIAVNLAAEVATRSITVNCIAPGFIASPMTDALNEKQRDTVLAAVPMGRLGVATDIGAAAVYLASAEAGYVTGQTLHVNGGMAMI